MYIDNKNLQVRVEITQTLIRIVDLYNISDNPNVNKMRGIILIFFKFNLLIFFIFKSSLFKRIKLLKIK